MAELKQVIEQSFSQYAGAVLQSRALVDVRDCLKPSARQIFYCLYTDKFTHDKQFKKTLKAIGSASRMYIHGDASAEGIIMRAGQPFAMRYPLIEVEGSFGNLMESGNWAAPRYTASRLTEFSEKMFNGINKNTIDTWLDNYDDTEQYPTVLPSIGFYNIVNGTMGIGIGASSSIPPTNLREVNEAIIKLIQNPEIDFDEIVCYPDFPTGATILNKEEVKESLRAGRGASCKIRSTIEYNADENCLIVTEIPYMVYTNTICGELEAIIAANEESTFIDRFNDLTGSTPLIKIYLKKGVNPKKAIDYLYKNTSLESYYSINFTMLKDGRWPMVFSWKQCLQEYITHIRICKRREIQFDLDKALARKNIVDGLIKAYSIIDEVVALIRSSNSPADASIGLQTQFQFNEEQAKAILAMKLSSLTKLDIVKLNNEAEELAKKIEWYRYLLNDSSALDNELIKILRDVATRFGDERRTKILNVVDTEEQPQEVTVEKELGVMLFDNNIIRAVERESLQGSKRGTKGTNIKAPKGATLIDTLYTTDFRNIALITSSGKIFFINLSELELNHDYSIYELINLSADEKVKLIIDSTIFNSYKNLVTVSKYGYIKKTDIKEYNLRARRGVAAVKLEDNDELVGAYFSNNDNDKIMIASNNGNYNYYSVGSISATGRVTRGVRAIKLAEHEFVQSATVVKDNIEYLGILTVNSNGNGKITPISEFSETSRGIKGFSVMNTKDGSLALIYAVPLNKTKFYFTANNKAVLLDVNSIPVQNRTTTGVRIIDTRVSQAEINIM